ncbi:MAG: DUF4340 domain-containing protein [Planctomycetota bacterium]
MTNKKLTILGIVAVAMIIWAAAQSRISNRPSEQLSGPAYLIQGLDSADIAGIAIGTGENQLTLKKTSHGEFVVVNKDNYPAMTSRINDLLTSCLDIKTIELCTDRKSNHQTLGVSEENAANIVRFLKSDSSVITGVVFGNDKTTGPGSYVRLVGDDRVYVTLDRPYIRTQPIDYIDQELFSIKKDDIESVQVSYPQGSYTLRSDANGTNIVLEELAEEKQLKGSVYKDVFNALTLMRFDDVSSRSKESQQADFDSKYVCRLKDSTVYTLQIARREGKTLVMCDAQFTDTTPVTKEKTVESDEQLKIKEARLLARDNAKDFAAKHNGWVYEIPEYKAKNLIQKLDDLIEDKTPPQETPGTSESE